MFNRSCFYAFRNFFLKYRRYPTAKKVRYNFNWRLSTIFGFQKVEILSIGRLRGAHMRHRVKFRDDQSNRCRDFAFLNRHLEFLKFQICNGRNGQEDRTASLCQITSTSLKRRPIYGDFSIFQSCGRYQSGFLKLQILTVGRVVSVESRHHAKFRGDRSNRCRDMMFFFFGDGVRPPSWICDACMGTYHEGHMGSLSLCKMWLESMPWF